MSELDPWRRQYNTDMDRATATYADVIAALRQLEVPARMEQTGGMCLAIMWEHPRGYCMLTDYEDSLPWDRQHHEGWTFGVYDEETNPLTDIAQTLDPSVEGAVVLVVRSLT